MRVAFRVDASVRIGSGHLMRCLTLADELRGRGAEISFICREHPGHLCALVETREYPVFRLPLQQGEDPLEGGGVSWEEEARETQNVLRKGEGQVDWLVVDHYGLDLRWEAQMRSHVRKILVIDDLADRPHDCDLLLDQNFYDDLDNRYLGLVAPDCRLLLGPRYALLRDEFLRSDRRLGRRDEQVQRILIFFGGSDPTNETAKALDALRFFYSQAIEVDVVLGGANPSKDLIQDQCDAWSNVHCHIQVDNMAELMSRADLSLGAGGSATWERCYLGLPTITIIVADNQTETTEALARTGAIVNLGPAAQVFAEKIAETVLELCRKPEKMKAMSDKSMAIIGGKEFQGAAGVTKELEKISL